MVLTKEEIRALMGIVSYGSLWQKGFTRLQVSALQAKLFVMLEEAPGGDNDHE